MKVIRVNDSNFDAVYNALKDKVDIGFDIESDNLNIDLAHVAVIQVHDYEKSVSYLFPVKVIDAKLSNDKLLKLMDLYKKNWVTGHSLAYDIRLIYRDFKVVPAGVRDDTYILACMRQCPNKALKTLAVQARPELLGKLSNFKDMMGIDEDDEKEDSVELTYSFEDINQITYMALDPYLPFIVKDYLYEPSLEKAYRADLDTIIQTAILTEEGLQVDLEKYREAVKLLNEERDRLQGIINLEAGYELRVNSTAQLARFLFEEKNLPATPIKTAKGNPSTSEEALKYLEGYPIVDTVLELKHMISVTGGAAKVPSYLDDENKIHPRFNLVGKDGTSRIYTTKPSLNQWTWEMRSCIVPAPGKKFVYADWKSAELYIACYLAGQQDILDIYNQGKDVHSYLSGLLLGVDNPDKEQREVSKTLTFATMYGSEGAAVSHKLKCSEDEAKDLVARYMRILDKVKDLRDRIHLEATKTHITRTILGRPRVLENFNYADKVEKGKRQSFNTMIQGSCADLQKIAIHKIYLMREKGVSFKFTVFDSFLLEVDEDMTDEDIRNVLDYISDFSDVAPNFKLRYDYGVAHDWKSAHDLS